MMMIITIIILLIMIIITFSIEKVLHWSKKSTSRFWWISTFWGSLSQKRSFLACLSVCLSVCLCLSVWLSNSKDNWASSTKFDMQSYMIKISATIAYEQNRLMGVASALRPQFSFLTKSALKMPCTKFFSDKSCCKSQYATFAAKFFYRATGLASALSGQFGFLVKSALKSRCTKLFFRQKLLQIKSCNSYVM